MSGVVIREADAGDRDAILALRARVFADVDQEKQDPGFWEWEFLGSPEGTARMFVAELQGTVHAHVAMIPQRWNVEGREIRAFLAVDAMTDESVRRRGVFTRVVAAAVEQTKGSFANAWQIRAGVLGAMTRNGFRSAAVAPVLLRPLSVRAVARQLGFRVARRSGSTTAADPLGAGDAAAMAEVAASFLPPRAHQVRSAGFLRWRLFEHPAARYEVTGALENSGLAAWVVTRRIELRGVPALAVVDLAWRPGARRLAYALLRAEVARAAADDLDVAAALVTRAHPAFLLLLRLGFVPGPHRFRFLLRGGPASSEWALTWIDTDHL